MKEKPRLTHHNEKVILVPFSKYEERMAICETCYARNKETNVCKLTGEPITARARLKMGACPQGFWSSYYGN
jgi:hypothetical protein